MRGALLAVALVAACASPPPAPPTGSPGSPAARMLLPADGPPQIAWDGGAALWVEIRHAASGRIVWRAAAGPETPRQGAALLRSPLAVQAMGPPPDVHPPDGRGPEASAPEPWIAGALYTVAVAVCPPTPSGCADAALHTTEFRAPAP